MTRDKHPPREQAAGRVRHAKGSVQEAIGKIIGDAGVERQGRRESDAGARQADALPDPDPAAAQDTRRPKKPDGDDG